MEEMQDMFGHVPQPERPPAEQRKPLTADDVRQRMLDLIDELRAAETVPFEAAVMKKHIAMFPIMAMWLDAEEGGQLVRTFEVEVARLAPA